VVLSKQMSDFIRRDVGAALVLPREGNQPEPASRFVAVASKLTDRDA
jgi:hypothetical protein